MEHAYLRWAKTSIIQGLKGLGPYWPFGPRPKKHKPQAYFMRIPPLGHIGEMAQGGANIGKNTAFWPSGPRYGPGSAARKETTTTG